MDFKTRNLALMIFYLSYAIVTHSITINKYCFELKSPWYSLFFKYSPNVHKSIFYFFKLEDYHCNSMGRVNIIPHSALNNESCIDTKTEVAEPASPVTKINLDKLNVSLGYSAENISNSLTIIFDYISDTFRRKSPSSYSFLEIEDDENSTLGKIDPKEPIFEYDINKFNYCGFFMEGTCAKVCYSKYVEDVEKEEEEEEEGEEENKKIEMENSKPAFGTIIPKRKNFINKSLKNDIIINFKTRKLIRGGSGGDGVDSSHTINEKNNNNSTFEDVNSWLFKNGGKNEYFQTSTTTTTTTKINAHGGDVSWIGEKSSVSNNNPGNTYGVFGALCTTTLVLLAY
ncbi:UNVERIFIED_CONTAM: hypothetical protein RMT77_017916 [Armadillidium vulgare]